MMNDECGGSEREAKATGEATEQPQRPLTA